MPIQTACPGCGKLLAVGDEHAGKKARCPACGTVFTVPMLASPMQASPIQGPDPHLSPGQYAANVANPIQPSGGDIGSETTAFSSAANGAAGTFSGAGTSGPDELYWMRALDGKVYGPTDRANLNRWFRESRVGAGYQIRRGENGLWEDAAIFQPDASPTAGSVGVPYGNPYAAQPIGYNTSGTTVPLTKYPKPDRGVLVLVMGILSFAICFVFGIVAIVMGRSALNDINAGLASPNDKPLVQIGFWLGVASCILTIAGIGIFILIIALSVANQI